MLETLQIIDREIEEIHVVASETLTLLTAPENAASPALYLSAISKIRHLHDLWARHIRSDSYTYALTASQRTDQHQLLRALQVVSATEWPRSVDLGLQALRIRGVRICKVMINELEQERLSVLSVLRRRIGHEHVIVRSAAASSRKGISRLLLPAAS